MQVSAGGEELTTALTREPKFKLRGTPAKGKLKVRVQALSSVVSPGPAAKLTVKPPD